MIAPGHSAGRKGALYDHPRLARRVAVKRFLARTVLFGERILPLLLPVLCIGALFVSFAWLGVFRMLPDWVRLALVFVLIFAFLASFLPWTKLRWPSAAEADRLLERRNGLSHQPVAVQDDAPAFDQPFARALWEEHQRRMAERIAALDAGYPQPDIARHDRFALRTIPALLLVIAFFYSGSNGAGGLADAFRWQTATGGAPGTRLDAWITPPGYTGRAPIFLTGRETTGDALPAIPQFSTVTIRLSGGKGDETVSFAPTKGEAIDIAAQASQKAGGEATAAADGTAATPANTTIATTYSFKLEQDGVLEAADRQWALSVVTDQAPEIMLDGNPRRAANGALEIPYRAKDDYGVYGALAEIEPVDAPDAGAMPLYPPPDYKINLPRQNARDAKGVASHDLTENPLAGKRVRITLVARDGAGQEGRSKPTEMVLPGKIFTQPLAAAVAEERQVFALDTRQLPRAIELNEALTLRPDETIPNLTHYLAIVSARERMKLSRTNDQLKDTADYLWEIALGIEDGNLSLAERKLRDAQQALADALSRNAGDDEIKKLMDDLRAAMQDFMKALAERQQNDATPNQQQAQNMLRSRDLDNILDQIENLARSGNRDAAQQMLSELQRMMNNLQTGRDPNGGQQQQNSEARKQIDKLGELMQNQQKLMDQTYQLDQALRDRMQRGDPDQDQDGENGENQPGQQQQGQESQEGDQHQGGQQPTDQMTAEQLREALKNLRQQQEGLAKQLQELQKGLKGLGIKPGDKFGEAQKQMDGAGKALGKGQGEQAVEGQGKALQALRDGARDMMNQMMQAMRGQGQGQQQGQGQGNQNGRDPLGRPRQTTGPDFDERVKVPDEIDVQRAREILEAIRKRLENNNGSPNERRYLERLLDIQQ
nr:TIGR02302 family protein [Rhizobium halophytocola]